MLSSNPYTSRLLDLATLFQAPPPDCRLGANRPNSGASDEILSGAVEAHGAGRSAPVGGGGVSKAMVAVSGPWAPADRSAEAEARPRFVPLPEVVPRAPRGWPTSRSVCASVRPGERSVEAAKGALRAASHPRVAFSRRSGLRRRIPPRGDDPSPTRRGPSTPGVRPLDQGWPLRTPRLLDEGRFADPKYRLGRERLAPAPEAGELPRPSGSNRWLPRREADASAATGPGWGSRPITSGSTRTCPWTRPSSFRRKLEHSTNAVLSA